MNFAEKIEDIEKENGVWGHVFEIREKFPQNRTWQTSMMNDQISDSLKSEKEKGKCPLSPVYIHYITGVNFLVFQYLPIRWMYVMWQLDICCIFGKISQYSEIINGTGV
jgi:hypothetical protein